MIYDSADPENSELHTEAKTWYPAVELWLAIYDTIYYFILHKVYFYDMYVIMFIWLIIMLVGSPLLLKLAQVELLIVFRMFSS